ncbi:MAG: nucleoside-diphosphate kinase [Planctomycetes bacterium]|nr:nucleoside-diphosphate kinase [Planctomycetota bacterium]
MERTLVIIKPDAVQRQLVGRIITRFENKGLTLAGLKLLKVNKNQAQKLYVAHKKKSFYRGLMKFITAGPVVIMVIKGVQAIAICRKMLGATFGPDADPGTIRGDFAASISYNLVHASDSAESSKYEIPIFFRSNEIISYDLHNIKWIYHPEEEKELEI